MDFLDDAAQKAKELFSVAYKKTGEVVNTGKQKLDIATLENKVAKDYEMLGRVYYNSVKTGEQLKADAIIASIDNYNEEIELKTKELLKNSSKQVCSKCGEFADINAAFCPSCGEKLKKESEE